MLQQKRLSGRGYGAFTLVELLVVIAIIGILVALLLPAVNAAREAARRATCLNQLKQMGLAALNYESAKKLLPSGGWGYRWVGDPDLGYGARQPGSWQFSILPYMEQQNLREMALGQSDSTAKANLLKQMVLTPIPDFQCPSRPVSLGLYVANTLENAKGGFVNVANLTDRVDVLGRSDYAANAGDADLGDLKIGLGSDPGPASIAAADTYKWYHSATEMFARTSALTPKPPFPYNGPTGVIFQRSEIALKDIADGTSKTYLMGEKFLDPLSYTSQVGEALNNDQGLYSGASSDNLRLTSDVINSNYPGWQPSKDKTLVDKSNNPIDITKVDNWAFGSVHAAGFQAVLCDGSARSVPFGVARRVHKLFGSRADEELLEENY